MYSLRYKIVNVGGKIIFVFCFKGKTNGVETRIRREKCPNLLEIDGESSHHMHNITKTFCGCFDKHCESLYGYLYNDHVFDSNQRKNLELVSASILHGPLAIFGILPCLMISI